MIWSLRLLPLLMMVSITYLVAGNSLRVLRQAGTNYQLCLGSPL